MNLFFLINLNERDFSLCLQSFIKTLHSSGKRHGFGIAQYSDHSVYEGYFENDLRHGHGCLTQGTSLTIARFENDKPNGYGIQDTISHFRYLGMFKDGERKGRGSYIKPDLYYQIDTLKPAESLLVNNSKIYTGNSQAVCSPKLKICLNGKGKLKIMQTSNFPTIMEGVFNGVWPESPENDLNEIKFTGNLKFQEASNSSNTLWWQQNKSSTSIDQFADSYQLSKSSLEGAVAASQRWSELFSYTSTKVLNLPENAADLNILPADYSANEVWRKISQSLRTVSIGENYMNIEKFIDCSASVIEIENYLEFALLHQILHPLYILRKALTTVFTASYTGSGCHPALLPSALKEFSSLTKRLFNLLRWIFPQIDIGKRVDGSLSPNASSGEPKSELQESDLKTSNTFTAGKLVLKFMLPGAIYEVLFQLYCENRKHDEERYWNKLNNFNRQSDDTALLEYFGYNNTNIFKHSSGNDSIQKDTLQKFINLLQTIETEHLPYNKLNVLEQVLEMIQDVATEKGCPNAADDVVPLMTFLMIRSRVRKLGVHLQFVHDFMVTQLQSGGLAYIFTTVKACYMYILNDEQPMEVSSKFK